VARQWHIRTRIFTRGRAFIDYLRAYFPQSEPSLAPTSPLIQV
jgi:hypothetical protein